jgi:hypothetical protein
MDTTIIFLVLVLIIVWMSKCPTLKNEKFYDPVTGQNIDDKRVAKSKWI